MLRKEGELHDIELRRTIIMFTNIARIVAAFPLKTMEYALDSSQTLLTDRSCLIRGLI